MLLSLQLSLPLSRYHHSGMTVSCPCSRPTSHQFVPSSTMPRDSSRMTLVFHAVVSRALPSVSHTLPTRTRRLWLCGQRRIACGAQQIRVDVLWCLALSEYLGLCGAQSNRFTTSDDRSTILLIRSFSHQLSSESTLLPPTSMLYARTFHFSALCLFLCLSRSVLDPALFAWPFQFAIWCHYLLQLPSAGFSEPIRILEKFNHFNWFTIHCNSGLHWIVSSQRSEVWCFWHLFQ